MANGRGGGGARTSGGRLAHCRRGELVLLKHGLILVSPHGVPVSPQTISNLPVGPPPGSTHNQLSTNFAPQRVP